MHIAMKKICIIQTGMSSSAELTALCAEIMPEVGVSQIIDDSILKEILAAGRISPALGRRMYSYCQQAQASGADAILYPCVAAAGIVEQIQAFLDIPIIRIDEGMARQAACSAGKVAVFATAPLALEQSMKLLRLRSREAGRELTLSPFLIETPRQTVRETAEKAAAEHDLILLAQPSMGVLLPLLSGLSKPVLHCTRSGVEYLRSCLLHEDFLCQGANGCSLSLDGR